MSTETVKPVHKLNAKLGTLVQKYNVKDAGTGTPFWMTLLKEKMSAIATVRLSTDKTKVFLRVMYDEDKEVNINLGMHYNALQTLADYEGQEIKIVVAPRIPNPALTDADIDAVAKNPLRGESAVANIRAARAASEPQGELTLVSYEEPED